MLTEKTLKSTSFLVGFDCFVCLKSESTILSNSKWFSFSPGLIMRQ